MGYICPYCGEGLPEDEECPCQAAGDLNDLSFARAARREQDRRRRDQMRAAGPVESFTKNEIGDRDGWVCGICQDTTRPVDSEPGAPRALSPSIDHVVPLSSGGQHVRANVRIAHLWCNVERNNADAPSPEYMRAGLSRVMDGTPIPEELYRSCFTSWRWPARPRIEYMIALSIDAGRVAADPRYGDPATRLTDAARQLSGDAAEDAMRRGRDWMNKVVQRRTPIDARWRSAR
jgi:5-methylcytosine-specific restriction endonuclease McrA